MDEIIVELAEAIGRMRALTDRESTILESSLRRMGLMTVGRLFWTPSEDSKLERLFRQQVPCRDGEVSRMVRCLASEMGRTEQAIWSRIRHLRRKGKIGYIEVETCSYRRSNVATMQAAE